MQKWEYLVVTTKGKDATASVYQVNGERADKPQSFWNFLREAGEGGWELVSVRNNEHYFKRPKT